MNAPMDQRLQLVQRLYEEGDPVAPLSLSDRALQAEYETLSQTKRALEQCPRFAAPKANVLEGILAAAQKATPAELPLSPEEALPLMQMLYGERPQDASAFLTTKARQEEYGSLVVAKHALEQPRQRPQPKPETVSHILSQAAQATKQRSQFIKPVIPMGWWQKPVGRWAIAASFVVFGIAAFLGYQNGFGLENGPDGTASQVLVIYEPPPSERVFAWDERSEVQAVSDQIKSLEGRMDDRWGGAPVPLEAYTGQDTPTSQGLQTSSFSR